MRSPKRARQLEMAAFLLGGIASLWVFHGIGDRYLDSFRLELGSTLFLSRGYVFFLVFWTVFGMLAALFFAGAFAAASRGPWASKLLCQLRDTSDSSLLLALSLIGFLIPFLIHWRVLLGADIADDESAYRFMSEVLVSGRLYAESPPMKLFFDRAFMINDGKLYSQYFLGWPALLAPGVAVGTPGLMNPLYSALTVPPIYLTLRRLSGRRCAMIGAVIFLSAPLLQLAAATQLSHTSCLFALAWASYFTTRIHTGDTRWWSHAALAASFSIAFFIRPTTALGIGLPLLGIWLNSISNLQGRTRWSAVGAFVLPAMAFAAAFLAVNTFQNGSPTYVAYQRAVDYARENGFRFAAWEGFPKERTVAFAFGAIDTAASRTGVSLTRLNYALFGWPLAFVFLPFAGWRSSRSWIAWCMLIGFIVLHAYMRDAGIDTIGPVHYLELSLPMILLTALGITRLTSWLRALRSAGLADVVSTRAPLALCLGLIVASALGYWPVRAAALHDVGSLTGLPLRAAEVTFERPTVVFAPRPFIPRDCGRTRNFIYFRPNNDPDLQNRILWVNHISVEHDRKLMEHYPDKDAVVMTWSPKCMPVFVPLAKIQDPGFPRGLVGGSGEVPPPEEMR
jgi:hypothetical protein